jgi:Domain of unknown function (DUF4037)
VEAAFLPGAELARRYYADVVRPLLDELVPGLAHSAALIGWGSDVLGFDSARSTDHNWGPRCQVFVGTGDAGWITDVTMMLASKLPGTFLGWPTRYPDVTAAGAGARHWVEVTELGGWLIGELGFDPSRGVGVLDWLATPTQKLAEVTGGAMFHDGLGPGLLQVARTSLAWYPHDIWRYLLACQWQRISQEEAFPGRCAEAGDVLGSAIIAARLARDLIRLVLLMHRQYPPYAKWLGTAFARISGLPPELARQLRGAISGGSWPERERSLAGAYEAVARMHNQLRLTEPVEVTTRGYYDRPYQVLDAGRVAQALVQSISSTEIRRLPLIGSVDQFVDSTDAADDLRLRRAAVSALLSR